MARQLFDNEKELASVKKPNDEVEKVSKEELVARLNELKRCRDDVVYFANNYFRIISPDVNEGRGGIGVIKLFPKQEELLHFFQKNNRVVCLAARQSAKTTTYNIFCLWKLCFYPNTQIMLLAQEATTAISLLGRIKMAYEYLPAFLKPTIVPGGYNKSSMEFSNHCTIKAFATASQGARGQSANLLIVDEAAFVPDNVSYDFFSSIYPTISRDKNAKVFFVSTPYGMSDKNLFYSTWKKAGDSDPDDINAWQRFRMDWWDVPGRDEKWKEDTIKSIGEEKFSHEFANEFIGSGASRLIPNKVIMGLRRHKLDKPEVTLYIESMNTGMNYTIKVWKRPQPGHLYIAGGDISEGIGADRSVLLIFDITDLKNVTLALSFYDANISISEYSALIARLLSCYNCPPFLAEGNGVGAGCLSLLNDHYHYENLISCGDKGLGIHSTSKNKMNACLWTKDILGLDELSFKLGDENLFSELENLVKSKNRANPSYGAPKGEHDDIALAFIWAMYILKPEIVVKQQCFNVEFASTELGIKIPAKFFVEVPEEKFVFGFEEDKLRAELMTGTERELHIKWFNPENIEEFQTSTTQNLPFFVVNHIGNFEPDYDDEEW